MDTQGLKKGREWIARMFRKIGEEGSAYEVITADLRQAKTLPQCLGAILSPRNLSLTSLIIILLLLVAALAGRWGVFIKLLLLAIVVKGILWSAYFKYWKTYRTLVAEQERRRAEVDEAKVKAILEKMKLGRQDCIHLDLTFSPGEDTTPGHSKYGGCPDVPEGFSWPFDDEGRPLSLLLQLDCAELAHYDKESLLPAEGHLYFFCELSELDGLRKDSMRVVYHDGSVGALHPCAFPDALDEEYRLKESSLRFSIKDSYPDYEDLLLQDPELKYEYIDEYEVACERLDYSLESDWNGTLLGHAFVIQEAVLKDPQNDILLLQFNSIETDDDYSLLIGDCGILYFVISREDLLARRFDRVRFEMQCC